MICCAAACLVSRSMHWSTLPPRSVAEFTWSWSRLDVTASSRLRFERSTRGLIATCSNGANAARLLVRRQALEYQRKNRGGRYRPADFLLHFRIQRWRKDSRKSAQIAELIGSPTRARTWDLRINSPSMQTLNSCQQSSAYM